MIEVLNGPDRWLAQKLLSRSDLTPDVLEHALSQPDLAEYVAKHPSVTQDQRRRLLESAETPPAIKDSLEKSELAKNIGHVTFPHLDSDALRNQSVFFPKHYSKYKGHLVGPASAKEEGATLTSQYKTDKPLPGEYQKTILLARRPKPKAAADVPAGAANPVRQRLFGDLPEGRTEQMKVIPGQLKTARSVVAAQAANATEGHEVQHGIFGRLGQKYGAEGRKKITREALNRIDPSHQEVLRRIFTPFSRAYHLLDHPEESIAMAHNYLMDARHRAKVHVKLGIHNDVPAQHKLQTDARKAFQALQNVGRALKPEDIGLPVRKHDAASLVAYGVKLAKHRDTTSLNIEDHLGYDRRRHKLLEAASFLSGKQVDLDIFRARLIETEDDVEAVLLAAGLTPADKPALLGVMAIADLTKSEKDLPKKAVALVPSAAPLAVDVQWAIDNDAIEHVKLGGKHSSGTLLARDEDGNLYLLKPGAGGISPAKGVGEEPASQSRREAAFASVAHRWGIMDVAAADLLSLDGKEVACIRMLGLDYTGLARATEEDPGLPRRVLRPYFDNGRLFRWSVLDYVLGSVDRHGNNLMVNEEGKVALIDHGSSFAGPGFDPANDENSFVPYYLRVWGPAKGWSKLSHEQRLKAMPSLSGPADLDFKGWFDSLDPQTEIADVLLGYGINPKPSLDRFAKIKEAMAVEPNASVAVNALWVL
jgi:hypothetical protein